MYKGTGKFPCKKESEEGLDLLVEQMAKQVGVTEQLKAQEQMLWAKRMNNIRERAEEVVKEKMIFIL